MLRNKTRITFTDDELECLCFYVFTKEAELELDSDNEKDISLIKKIKGALTRMCMEDIKDDFLTVRKKAFWTEDKLGMTKEEYEEEKNAIKDIEGVFFCPVCKVRTNQKTYETKCVICHTGLNRV